MDNSTYWEYLINKYENMSDEDFEKLVDELDQKNEPFLISENMNQNLAQTVPFLKNQIWRFMFLQTLKYKP